MPCEFQIGDIVEIIDKIDTSISSIATVRLIEPDNELPGLFWIYLMANEEVLNSNLHPTIGSYWDIIPSDSEFIKLLSRATMS
jgi:hypothetical protein